jgi:hypothetical protein
MWHEVNFLNKTVILHLQIKNFRQLDWCKIMNWKLNSFLHDLLIHFIDSVSVCMIISVLIMMTLSLKQMYCLSNLSVLFKFHRQM